MKNFISDYSWQNIRFRGINYVFVNKAVSHDVLHGVTHMYQLAIKVEGATDIIYNGVPLDFCSRTVIYLPKEKDKNVPYDKTYLQNGYGYLIMFDSPDPLPDYPFSVHFDNDNICEKFKSIYRAYNKPNRISSFETLSLFYEILHALERQIKLSNQASLLDRLVPAINYIEQHVTDEYIDIPTLGNICSMSTDYFRHQFKALYGVSPSHYICSYKLLKIKEHLCQNNLTIKETAKIFGFSDVNYFCRFFKKHTGLSPLNYQKNYQNIGQ